MERQPPPLYIIVPGRVYRPDNDATHTPQFHQIEGLAVDTDITLGDLQGTLLRVRARDLRRGARGPPAARTSSRSPSRASRSMCRASTATDGVTADGQRCPLCKGTAWIEILGAGMVDPNVFEYVRDYGYDPEQSPGVRVRHGDRADRDAQARHPRPAAALRQRRALPGAVRLMRVPLAWLHEYVAPDLDTHALAERLAMTGTEVERIEHHGVAALENFVDRPRARGRAAPERRPPERLPRRHRRRRPSQIVCGAPNVAAGQTVAVAKPGAVMPDGTKLGKAKLRGIESNGMILAEDEVAIGTEHDGIMVLEPTGSRPGRRSRTSSRSPPTCSCSRSRRTGPTASRSTGSRARSTPRPARHSRRRRGETTPASRARSPARRSPSSAPTCARASPRACSRTSRSDRARCG